MLEIAFDLKMILFNRDGLELLFSGFKNRSHNRRDQTPPQESGNGDTVGADKMPWIGSTGLN